MGLVCQKSYRHPDGMITGYPTFSAVEGGADPSTASPRTLPVPEMAGLTARDALPRSGTPGTGRATTLD